MNDTEESNAAGHYSGLSRLARGIGGKRVPVMAILGVVLSAILSYVVWALVTAFGPSSYEFPWVQPVTATVAIALGVVTALGVLLWAANQSFQRETRRARQQIDGEQPSIYVNNPASSVNIYARSPEHGTERSSQLIEPDVQESMLTEIYSHGIAQAKLSFFISLVFGTLGSLVLLTGAGLAVTHAASNGQRYAAIVAQVSGAVINLLAGVFFLQSNRTRKDMGAQGVMLRDDSRSDRRLKAAGILVDNITDESLRDQTRAQMALQLVDSNALVFTTNNSSHRRTPHTNGAAKDQQAKTGQDSNSAKDQAT